MKQIAIGKMIKTRSEKNESFLAHLKTAQKQPIKICDVTVVALDQNPFLLKPKASHLPFIQ